MDYEVLKTEIESGPLAEDLASAVKTGNDTAVAAALNLPRTPGLRRGASLTERGILDLLGPVDGDAALSAIETAAGAGNSLLARVVRILRDYSGGGLDFGSASTQAQVDAMQSAGLLTAESAAAIKAYGTRLWSRGEIALGEGVVVSIEDVARALRG